MDYTKQNQINGEKQVKYIIRYKLELLLNEFIEIDTTHMHSNSLYIITVSTHTAVAAAVVFIAVL